MADIALLVAEEFERRKALEESHRSEKENRHLICNKSSHRIWKVELLSSLRKQRIELDHKKLPEAQLSLSFAVIDGVFSA